MIESAVCFCVLTIGQDSILAILVGPKNAYTPLEGEAIGPALPYTTRFTVEWFDPRHRSDSYTLGKLAQYVKYINLSYSHRSVNGWAALRKEAIYVKSRTVSLGLKINMAVPHTT